MHGLLAGLLHGLLGTGQSLNCWRSVPESWNGALGPVRTPIVRLGPGAHKRLIRPSLDWYERSRLQQLAFEPWPTGNSQLALKAYSIVSARKAVRQVYLGKVQGGVVAVTSTINIRRDCGLTCWLHDTPILKCRIIWQILLTMSPDFCKNSLRLVSFFRFPLYISSHGLVKSYSRIYFPCTSVVNACIYASAI
jgi:hypothetical protein